jgi:hypothetical protein
VVITKSVFRIMVQGLGGCVPPDDFAAFRQAGFVKIAGTLRVRSD